MNKTIATLITLFGLAVFFVGLMVGSQAKVVPTDLSLDWQVRAYQIGGVLCGLIGIVSFLIGCKAFSRQ